MAAEKKEKIDESQIMKEFYDAYFSTEKDWNIFGVQIKLLSSGERGHPLDKPFALSTLRENIANAYLVNVNNPGKYQYEQSIDGIFLYDIHIYQLTRSKQKLMETYRKDNDILKKIKRTALLRVKIFISDSYALITVCELEPILKNSCLPETGHWHKGTNLIQEFTVDRVTDEIIKIFTKNFKNGKISGSE